MLLDLPIYDVATEDGARRLFTGDDGRNRGYEGNFTHMGNRLRLSGGRRYALLGRNGCGKTTLLNAIASGSLPGWPANVSTYLVEQDPHLDETQTVLAAVLAADERLEALRTEAATLEAEADATDSEAVAMRLCEIYETLEAKETEADGVREFRAESILTGLGFSATMMSQPIKVLSGGWRTRVGLARALFIAPQLLLLDEPTNHLDLHGILWLRNYLVNSFTGTLLVVAHDRRFLEGVGTDVIGLDGTRLTYYHGALSELESRRAEDNAGMRRQVEALERRKKHIQQSVDKMRQAAAGKHGDQKRSDQVSSRQKKLGRMGLEKTEDGKKFNAQEHGIRRGADNNNDGDAGGAGTMRKMVAASLLPKDPADLRWGFSAPAGLGVADDSPILELRDVSFGFSGDDNEHILKDVQLSLTLQSRVALVGRNGAGKSTLMQLMTGDLEPTSGEVWRHRNLRVAYFSQHTAGLLEHLPQSAFAYMQACFPKTADDVLRRQLGSFGISSGVKGTSNLPLRALSGGQRVRVAFARLAMEQPHILFLDEPTNHLDLYSIDALSSALQAFAGAVVLISHNADMLSSVAHDVYTVLRSKHTVHHFNGNASDYVAQRFA